MSRSSATNLEAEIASGKPMLALMGNVREVGLAVAPVKPDVVLPGIASLADDPR